MRRGLAVVLLVFSIREREAGRLLIPMDNVCSACLPALCLDNAREIETKKLRF